MTRDDVGATRATVLETIGQQALGFRSRSFTSSTAAAAKRVIVDWFAVTCGGADGVVATALTAAARESGGPCRLLGTAVRTGAPLAALVNGTAAHTLELDDIYAPGTFHPGAPVIAAAFALAEARGVSGRDFLRAVISGYEVGNRIATDLGPAHYRIFHTTGTAGALGAAAAGADILQLSPNQTMHALAIAGTLAAGLQQTFRSDAVAKPLHAGNAAHAGVVAALAAQGGATGALDVLDGEIGLAYAMAANTDWSASRAAWASTMLIESMTMKAYPCCGHTFAAIDAAGLLRDEISSLDEIERIDVETYQVAIETAGIARPVTPAEAKFSIAFTVATMLVHGGVDLASFAQSRVDDPEITALLGRVHPNATAEFTGPFPQRRGARVAIHLVNGRSLEVAVPDRFGSPENPMTQEQLERKFRDLVARSSVQTDADVLLHQLMNIEDVEALRALAV